MKWSPLVKIAHGIAINPFIPSEICIPLRLTDTTASSTHHQQSTSIEDYKSLIPLEIGDEVFIIEQCGQWYRGYVMSALEEGRTPNKAPIGCFPRNHIQIKEYINFERDGSILSDCHNRKFDYSPSDNQSPDRVPPFDLTRSLSESYIQIHKKSDHPIISRSGSFSGYEKNNPEFTEPNRPTVIHNPPPPLPLIRYDQSTIIGHSEPLVDEIAVCITEWNTLLYKYINERNYKVTNQLRESIYYLLKSRRQIINQMSSREETAKLKKDTIQKMVSTSIELNKDIVVRHPLQGYSLDSTNASLSTIYQMYWKYVTDKCIITLQEKDAKKLLKSNYLAKVNTVSSAETEAAVDTLEDFSSSNTEDTEGFSSNPYIPIRNSSVVSDHALEIEGAKFFHLLVELKSNNLHVGHQGEFIELQFALFSALEHKLITEKFVVRLNFDGTPRDGASLEPPKGLFVDLSLHDISEGLYLVCRILRIGSFKQSEHKDHSIHHYFSHFRHSSKHIDSSSKKHMVIRPFGCAVLKLSSLIIQQKDEQSQQQNFEYDMPVYISVSESDFSNLHENIINDRFKDLVKKSSQEENLRISIRSFYGFLHKVMKDNLVTLQSIPHVLRLGFADVSFPADNRNDLYIRLDEGDFRNFGRFRNIQVSVCVRDNETGEILKNAIYPSGSLKGVSYWESLVIYHEPCPKWCQLIKIRIENLNQWRRSHVFVTIKHRSKRAFGSGSVSPMLKFSHGSSRSNHVNDPQLNQFRDPTELESQFSGGSENILAIGFLPLFLPPFHIDFIADGTHKMCLYKFDRLTSLPQHYVDVAPWCVKSTSPSNMVRQSTEMEGSIQTKPYYFNRNSSKRSNTHSVSGYSFKSNSGSGTSSNSLYNGKNGNLNQGPQSPSPHSVLNKIIPLHDTITLTTFLCSTKFTQNKTLVKLFNWQMLSDKLERGKSELLSVLNQFTFVGEVEVVKFLGDVFDTLFDIMAYYQNEEEPRNHEIYDQILAAIVWLLGIVQDRRFSNFRPVLDAYIRRRFSTQMAGNSVVESASAQTKEATYKCLISSLTRLCKNPSEPSKAKILRSSMKVWDYLFYFIVSSRLYHQKQKENENQPHDSFETTLDTLLDTITVMMSPDHPNSMVGTQTLALQHFSDILSRLKDIIPCTKRLKTFVSFVDASSHVTGKLIGYKLALILNVTKNPNFTDNCCRLDMIKHTLRWIKPSLNSYAFSAKETTALSQSDKIKSDGGDNSNFKKIGLSKAQWVENIRLSLTIMINILTNLRTWMGITSSCSISSVMTSLGVANGSRPTSFVAVADDDLSNSENVLIDQVPIMQELLKIIPQMLATYRDLQSLATLIIQVSNPETSTSTDTANMFQDLRSYSCQSYGLIKNRTSNTSSSNYRNPTFLQDLSVDSESSHPLKQSNINSILSESTTFSSNLHANDSNNSNNSTNKFKIDVALQALSTSPEVPFPSTYPFQHPNPYLSTDESSFTNEQAILVSTGLLDLTVVFLEMLNLTPEYLWISYILNMLENDSLEATTTFVREIVYTCMGILFGDDVSNTGDLGLTAYDIGIKDRASDLRKIPYKWLNLSVTAHKIILCRILSPLKIIMKQPSFMPSNEAFTPIDEGSQRSWSMSVDTAKKDSRKSTSEGVSSIKVSTDDMDVNLNSSLKLKKLEEERSSLYLWRIYMVSILRIMASSRLDLVDRMSETQRSIWRIINNMRGEVGARIVIELWKLAGESSKVPIPTQNSQRRSSFNDHNSLTGSYDSSFGLDYIQTPFNSYARRRTLSNGENRKKKPIGEQDINVITGSNRNRSSTHSSNTFFSCRHSLNIAPTDEIPMSTNQRDDLKYTETIVPFLQVDLAQFILKPICSVMFTYYDQVRKNALMIMADIMANELYYFGDLIYTQKVIIGALDHFIMIDQKGNEELASRITFEVDHFLTQRLQKDNREDLLELGKKHIKSFDKFCNLILHIRSLPQDDEEYMDERITATLRMMNFIKFIEREEIYIKYVHQLVKIHIDNLNFTEAALTLKFHSDLLQWNPDDKLSEIPELDFPEQSSFERKERLYMIMLDYLDQSSAWETSIRICKELGYEYEYTVFDYQKLSLILRRQAEYVENITSKARCFTEYFRVGFYGRGFPSANQNRQYIYRGLEWEKIDSFVERMQNQHPNATLLPSNMSNSPSLTEDQIKELNSSLDGKYIMITPVVPIPSEGLLPYRSIRKISDGIKDYFAFNEVNRFMFSHPVIKEGNKSADTVKNPEDDFLNLWTERIIFETDEKFPSIVKRYRITNVTSALISPIENAIDNVEKKNNELESLEKKFSMYISKNGQDSTSIEPININPLSMSLNGAIDAPINGGIPLYKKAFLSDEYWEKNPNMRTLVVKLRSTIQNQILIIEKCLETHNKLVSNDMRPLHTTLTEIFYKKFADDIRIVKEKENIEKEKEKGNLRSATSSEILKKRRSTLSNAADASSVCSHYFQQAHEELKPIVPPVVRRNTLSMSQASGSGGVPVIPSLSSMSPVSRAFSLKANVTENTPGLMSAENTVMPRSDSISRAFKLTLRKKNYKKN